MEKGGTTENRNLYQRIFGDQRVRNTETTGESGKYKRRIYYFQEVLTQSARGAVECPKLVGMQEIFNIVQDTQSRRMWIRFNSEVAARYHRSILEPCCFISPGYGQHVVKFRQT